jgi:hypothetical protein
VHSSPRPRPGPARWLWWSLSGRLDPRFRDWAFHDLTCRTWPLRHLARLVVPAVPVAAALIAVLPGPLSVRVTATVTGVVIGLLYSFVFLHESSERRAVKLGFAPGAADRARRDRVAEHDLAREAERFLRDRQPPPRWRRWW